MADAKQQVHIILVHGACHGAWCWYKLKPLLEAAGHRVTALDLAASGIDRRRLEELHTFADYSQPLLELMASIPLEEKVVLVGHSLGGMNLVLAMDMYPQKIKVAVFLAVVMPDSIHKPSYVLNQGSYAFWWCSFLRWLCSVFSSVLDPLSRIRSFLLFGVFDLFCRLAVGAVSAFLFVGFVSVRCCFFLALVCGLAFALPFFHIGSLVLSIIYFRYFWVWLSVGLVEFSSAFFRFVVAGSILLRLDSALFCPNFSCDSADPASLCALPHPPLSPGRAPECFVSFVLLQFLLPRAALVDYVGVASTLLWMRTDFIVWCRPSDRTTSPADAMGMDVYSSFQSCLIPSTFRAPGVHWFLTLTVCFGYRSHCVFSFGLTHVGMSQRTLCVLGHAMHDGVCGGSAYAIMVLLEPLLVGYLLQDIARNQDLHHFSKNAGKFEYRIRVVATITGNYVRNALISDTNAYVSTSHKGAVDALLLGQTFLTEVLIRSYWVSVGRLVFGSLVGLVLTEAQASFPVARGAYKPTMAWTIAVLSSELMRSSSGKFYVAALSWGTRPAASFCSQVHRASGPLYGGMRWRRWQDSAIDRSGWCTWFSVRWLIFGIVGGGAVVIFIVWMVSGAWCSSPSSSPGAMRSAALIESFSALGGSVQFRIS
ncbi:Salicylic acid-binding protein 2 [Sesamum angolense]|uniref:Salicylic acid-binding protein 2 n=1 Tax=Sesamum angolense TaxID=2727404 RepID=A0AAE1WIK2_9LAMI|nr:Salicylic acid-binding protein 2 [Sesamum angolense]